MKKFFLNLIDWIYKKKCYCCNSSRECVPLCSKCYNNIRFNSFNVNKIINGSNIYIAGLYEENLQKIIRGLKYHQQKELGYYVAKFMYEYFVNLGLDKDFLIVSVPMHKKREKKRKYNHMDIIAKEFCNLTGFEYNLEIIKRIKDTKPQYKLSKEERLNNLKKAFAIDITKYNGKPILILDDICTTGSTFESLIEELHKSGIEDITCFAVSTPKF